MKGLKMETVPKNCPGCGAVREPVLDKWSDLDSAHWRYECGSTWWLEGGWGWRSC